MGKYNEENVKSYVESYGYILMSKYKGIESKIELICPNGHVYETTFNSFKNKNVRCRVCKNNEKIEFITKYIENENYKLFDIKVEDYNTRVLIQCPNNHEPYWTKFANFKNNNRRCKICGFKKVKEYRTHNFDYVKSVIEGIGYELLSDSYENTHEKLEMKCDKGHVFKMSFKQVKDQNARCPICQRKKASERMRLSYGYVKEYLLNFGYTLLSDEYLNARSHIDVMCPNGHKYRVGFNTFKRGSRCPICYMSSGETEVKRVLEKLNVNFTPQYTFSDCRSKRELPFDFYLPEHNTCIEFDGGQHYRIIKHFGGFDGFVSLKIRDTI
ncbi:MAG: hypothetical protein ACRC28_06385, partial [Clostridium sp.]|uniref:hypothetical protein n=1 Tax=Clostridium sp. TaxID=1506 RepID=UPI003F35E7DC